MCQGLLQFICAAFARIRRLREANFRDACWSFYRGGETDSLLYSDSLRESPQSVTVRQ